MIRITDIKIKIEDIEDLKVKIEKMYKIKEIKKLNIVRKAIDARDKNNIYFVYTVDLEVLDETKYLLNKRYKNIKSIEKSDYITKKVLNITEKRPVIIGSGPAGLFSALVLVEAGLKPIIIERGKKVEERITDIETFTNTRILDKNSNIQFGEGGAGTFSDGKLTTGIKDQRIGKVIGEFVSCGAKEEIKYSSKPHIGTDVLVDVIKNLREKLIKKGATFRFNTLLTNLIIKENKIIGVEINHNEIIDTDNVILAIGHSARDTFKMLYHNKVELESKIFSIGVRIEHLQEMFNKEQYGKYYNDLDPVDYKLVYHAPSKRSAYTFCVCPGGFVVPATSEEEHVVTNGMSKSKRDHININGALLVGVDQKDFENNHPLAGIEFQEKLERKAFVLGGSNYNAPVQLVGDFLLGKPSTKIGKIKPTYLPGVTLVDLNELLPSYISDTLKEAIQYFDSKIKGFAEHDAILTGIETRSSCPVRILRNDDFESTNIEGLYPAGEGSGYAGGIVSSAVDGIKVAEAIIDKLNKY